MHYICKENNKNFMEIMTNKDWKGDYNCKMDKLEIEFKQSGTGSYSPWHLDIADEYDEPLFGTSDIGYFVKIDNDIYKIELHCYYKLYQYVCMLEEMNDKGEITDEEVLKKIDDIVNNKNQDFKLKKCISLEEFREIMEKRKNNGNKTVNQQVISGSNPI